MKKRRREDNKERQIRRSCVCVFYSWLCACFVKETACLKTVKTRGKELTDKDSRFLLSIL